MKTYIVKKKAKGQVKDISLEWGKDGELYIIFPEWYMKENKLKEGSEMDVSIQHGTLILTPIKRVKKKKK